MRTILPLVALLGMLAGCTAAVSSVSPSSVAAGSPPFSLTVLGRGFTQESAVQWNGAKRSTTYVSATELVAQINAADIATTGSASVTVSNPYATGASSSTGSSAASNAETVSIVAPSIDATAFQIDPAHDGAMTFASVSFPAAATWHVSLGAGAPSNLVVADDRVFLTLGTSSGSELLALDQATGATAWGPTAIAGVRDGSAGVAYDDGRLFVTDNQSGISSLYAYDAGTGALDWSSAFDAGSAGAPTAADGLVYVIVTGSATLYALDESTGAISWQQPLSSAGGIPAVTADGVYVTATSGGCYTFDFRPATGEVIWNGAAGTGFCPQTAAGTPIVANQLVYSPSSSGTSIFSAETGGSSGTLADSLPAAFTTNMAYFPVSPDLDAVTLSDGTVAWTFNGNGSDLTALPIIVNQYLITGSADGSVYALDATSGSTVWTRTSAGEVVQLAAGDGLLLVLNETNDDGGGTLTAYTLSSSP
jgi:outer membrane protein assembly factor BamB